MERMILRILLFSLFAFFSTVSAQDSLSLCKHKYKMEQLSKLPDYVGGVDTMNLFLYQKLINNCVDTEDSTVVNLKFTVNKNGELFNVQITDTVSYYLNDDIIKAFKAMPKWVPANINGADVCTDMTLIVHLADVLTYFPRPLCKNKYEDKQLTQLAEYEGGEDAMNNFIYKNLTWTCGDRGFNGIVVVSCMVDEAGELWNIDIVQSVASCLDKEIINVFKLMPSWKPAKINGVKVCSDVIIPVRFRLGFKEK